MNILRAESSWFNAGEVDVPLRLELFVQALGEALDGPFGGTVLIPRQ